MHTCTHARSAEVEIEDFHFQYQPQDTGVSADTAAPPPPSSASRIFNDMITLRTNSPLVKLTISHAVAQSAKLTRFENVMEDEVARSSRLPKMMALYGEVKLRRDDVLRVVGRLFKLRVDVNLISNVLDTPELFWSEPELEGLYNAIRDYLEISQRVKLLNSRAEVVSDTLDMLTEHLNGSEMTFITWIIIALIVVSCIIAVAEIYVKILMARVGMEV
ncbi:hypothetical protein HK405_014989 [Cladochytrium tenue]|nr:hypothetical protein HK405_014989 [Cladochytrium tenue]